MQLSALIGIQTYLTDCNGPLNNSGYWLRLVEIGG
jgi:hypothetical protein